jgi:hypothetical protein
MRIDRMIACLKPAKRAFQSHDFRVSTYLTFPGIATLKALMYVRLRTLHEAGLIDKSEPGSAGMTEAAKQKQPLLAETKAINFSADVFSARVSTEFCSSRISRLLV